MQAHSIAVDVFQDSLTAMMKRYKDEVKSRYIFAAPNTAAAYFALFQKVNNYLIFDPLNSRDDIKCFCGRSYEPEQLLSSCQPFKESV